MVPSAPWTADVHVLACCCPCSGADDSFTSNNLELVRVQRGPGLNDVGMVAWHITLKTPECQQGRQVRRTWCQNT